MTKKSKYILTFCAIFLQKKEYTLLHIPDYQKSSFYWRNGFSDQVFCQYNTQTKFISNKKSPYFKTLTNVKLI